MMRQRSDLTIVGAGAKAAAIATKVHVLNRLGLGPIGLTIVESAETAASWTGRNGMTSGDEPLAIPPIKDVGFPYQSHETFGEAGESIDRATMELSWQQYLIHEQRYARWVNADSPAVRHRDYGHYLKWVLSRATEGVEIVEGRVSRVTPRWDVGRWEVDVDGRDGASQLVSDALVLTGAGVHRQLPHDLAAAPFVFHCDSKRGELGEMPAARELDVAIVGGGESALSCMAFLREFRPNARVTVYTPGLPLSRGESFLENRAFSNPDEIGWSSLSLQMRRDFIKHCDRGVFDVRSLATFAADERCTFRTGRVLHIGAAGAGVFVDYLSGSEPDALRARHDYAVNCTGFDLLAQMHGLFDERSRTEIERRTGALWSRTPGEELPIGRALELTGLRPRLHVPGLGALSQGPGFANLGCLGLLANRVLQPLVVERETPSQRRSAPIDTSVPAES